VQRQEAGGCGGTARRRLAVKNALQDVLVAGGRADWRARRRTCRAAARDRHHTDRRRGREVGRRRRGVVGGARLA